MTKYAQSGADIRKAIAAAAEKAPANTEASTAKPAEHSVPKEK